MRICSCLIFLYRHALHLVEFTLKHKHQQHRAQFDLKLSHFQSIDARTAAFRVHNAVHEILSYYLQFVAYNWKFIWLSTEWIQCKSTRKLCFIHSKRCVCIDKADNFVCLFLLLCSSFFCSQTNEKFFFLCRSLFGSLLSFAVVRRVRVCFVFILKWKSTSCVVKKCCHWTIDTF